MNNNTDIQPVNCKNCNSPVTGNYCGECGQSVKTERINKHYLLHEFQHSILHVDKGILYTIKELLLQPDVMIKGYLEGKRVGHFKPFAFVIILATIYGIIAHYLKYYPSSFEDENTAHTYQEIMNWVNGHYSLATLALIPFYALSSFFIFRKSRYNYLEHLIIYDYIAGIQIVMSIVLFPVYYNLENKFVLAVCLIIPYIYNIWVIGLLFKEKSWITVICKTILSLTLGFLLVMLMAVCGGLLYVLVSE